MIVERALARPMPFPLAHPAAVLPLRRYCPRTFNFPALVIGSLTPDAGYCFGPLHLAAFSHRFLAGAFGFCLPAGLLLFLLFHGLRRPVVRQLPPHYRLILEPHCQRPAGPLPVIIASLLAGAWTHILLDSITHEEGWIAGRPLILEASVAVGTWRVRVCDLLYGVCTFAGAACVAWCVLNSAEKAARAPGWILPGFKWVAAFALAALTLLLSYASHRASHRLGLVAVGVLTALLVAAFLLAAGCALLNRDRNPL